MAAGRGSQSAQPPGWVQDSLAAQAELYWLNAQPVPENLHMEEGVQRCGEAIHPAACCCCASWPYRLV